MSIAASMIPEFDQEMQATRRMLERVPDDRAEWKPHPKSFAIGHLAQLLSWMPGWFTNTLTQSSLDLAGAGGYTFEPTAKLVAVFDQNVASARAALAAATDASLAELWTLKHGDAVLFTTPRGIIIRNHMSHLIHHRGQLSVYLRLLDIPVPSVYGPTADERTW
jgi:uncharacterized damage-inducible protein DinB